MGAKMYNKELYYCAGIDPITNKTYRPDECESELKRHVKVNLTEKDKQEAIQRFTWTGLPKGLTSELMERILYYRGQGIFFYLKEKERFFFLPYSPVGGIDVYGRFNKAMPLSFNGSLELDEKELKPFIKGLTYDIIYDAQLPEDYITIDFDGSISVNETKIKEIIENGAVIINDRSLNQDQSVTPRALMNTGIIDVMSDMIPFARTTLLNSTGIDGVKVGSAAEASNVLSASKTLQTAALRGDKWIPVEGTVQLQNLTSGGTGRAEEFFLALQSLDNYRLSLYGLNNNGVYQKKAHMLQDEQDMNAGNIGLVFKDSLDERQKACNIINSIHGLGIWCIPSETVLGFDTNGDMIVGSDEKQPQAKPAKKEEEKDVL